jgi:ribonuclease HII
MAGRSDVPRYPDLAAEQDLLRIGRVHIAGLDEAGRGAWAGPVVAAAVVLPLERDDLLQALHGVRDSKQMTPRQRLAWAERIHQIAVDVAVGQATPEQVDRIGVLAATRLAMACALDGLRSLPDHLLLDYVRLTSIALPQTAITHGDARALSIAAASVIAKVERDQRMRELDQTYPGYGFAAHKGYGTARHRVALERLGPCAIHRRTYAPVAALL